MGHGYHMGYGHNMGYGFYGSYILILILIILVIIALFLLKNKKKENPFVIKLIDILKEKYATGIITADEYIERKTIIEETNDSNPYITILLKRYALCEVGTKELFDIKNVIESANIDTFIKEKLAKGELSYDEYRTKR